MGIIDAILNNSLPTFLLAGFGLLLGAMGAYVSIKAPTGIWKGIWFGGFVLVSSSLVVTSLYDSGRDAASQVTSDMALAARVGQMASVNQSRELATATRLQEREDKLAALIREQSATTTTVLRETIDNLGTKAPLNPNAFTEYYEFNGILHTSRAGSTSANPGERHALFQEKLVPLRRAENWSALRDICEAQIPKSPGWLTPYLFSGIAHLNLGFKIRGIERLEYVEKRAVDDPDYAEAKRILQQLRR